MRKRTAGWMAMALTVAMIAAAHASAAGDGVLGTWQEEGGAKIEVHRCGTDVCLRVLTLSRDAAGTVDAKNPDAALRGRALVGLEIGQGFHLTDAEHADGGTIYDPKSGKTYHSTLASEGDKLKLRGYVGIKAFGKTEVWTRVQAQQR